MVYIYSLCCNVRDLERFFYQLYFFGFFLFQHFQAAIWYKVHLVNMLLVQDLNQIPELFYLCLLCILEHFFLVYQGCIMLGQGYFSSVREFFFIASLRNNLFPIKRNSVQSQNTLIRIIVHQRVLVSSMFYFAYIFQQKYVQDYFINLYEVGCTYQVQDYL